MNIALTSELTEFVNAKIASGQYNSASEVISTALRLLQEKDELRNIEIVRFNEELDRRLTSLDRGYHIPPSEVRARLKRKSLQRRESKA